MVEGFIFEFVGIGFGCCGYGCVGDLVVFGFVVVVDDFVFIDCQLWEWVVGVVGLVGDVVVFDVVFLVYVIDVYVGIVGVGGIVVQ